MILLLKTLITLTTCLFIIVLMLLQRFYLNYNFINSNDFELKLLKIKLFTFIKGDQFFTKVQLFMM